VRAYIVTGVTAHPASKLYLGCISSSVAKKGAGQMTKFIAVAFALALFAPAALAALHQAAQIVA
jgi:hypothetical protein